jgi:hypothetical protein
LDFKVFACPKSFTLPLKQEISASSLAVLRKKLHELLEYTEGVA